MRHRPVSSLEALEARIAPAVLTVGAVTITTSKGTLADLTAAAVFDTAGDGHLISLTLGTKFKGSDVSVVSSAGAGMANVGLIEAAGIDLGTVVVDGDLGQLNAGDAVPSTPALRRLEVGSLGTTLSTQAPGGDVDSHVLGRINTLLVRGNVLGTLNLDGPNGSLGTATIDGMLAGGAASKSGSLFTSRAIGSIKVGSLGGSDGDQSGGIFAGGTITKAEILGNIIGGKGSNSGILQSFGDLLNTTIGGSVIGGTDVGGGANSGLVFASGKIGTLTITGQLKGGVTLTSGAVTAGAGGIDLVTVNGGLLGGTAEDTGTIATSGVLRKAVIGSDTQGMTGGAGVHSGSLLSSTRIANVEVNGNIQGGNGVTSGVIASDGTIGTVVVNGDVIGGNVGLQSGSIGSAKAMTSVTVTGDVRGGIADKSAQIVSITSIASISVGGSVIGGDGDESGALGALGSVGTVTITGLLQGGVGDLSGSVLTGGSLTNISVNTIEGGAGNASGRVGVGGTLTKLTVAGDLRGGPGNFSATVVVSGTTKSIEVGGSFIAHPGNPESGVAAPISTASIACFGPILSVEVDGDLRGEGDKSGAIYSTGEISKVVVHGSFAGGNGFLSGSVFTERVIVGDNPLPGKGIGTVLVEGNMAGGEGQFSGSIRSVGDLGSATIGLAPTVPPIDKATGLVQGGAGLFSGVIFAAEDIGSAKVFGSLLGLGSESAQISAGGNIGSVEIGGNVNSARGSYDLDDRFGQINALGRISSLLVKGSLIGGSGNYGGTVAAGAIVAAEIVGNVTGGTAPAAGSILALTGDITRLTIGGTISTFFIGTFAESALEVGSFPAAGAISAAAKLGTITIGSISGNFNAPVIISAGGKLNPTTDAQALAIKSLRVTGAMEYARVLAGYSLSGEAVNGDVQIGTVDVGSGQDTAFVWSENDIIAGFDSSGDNVFGDGDDFLVSGASGTKVLSKISNIIVRGSILNTGDFTRGIEAELVNSITVAGVAEPQLTPGPKNDFFALTADASGTTLVFEGVQPR